MVGEGGLAVKNRVNTASFGGKFDAPITVPQLLIHGGGGEKGGGGGLGFIRSIVYKEIIKVGVFGALIHVSGVVFHLVNDRA